jgi:hypothetical protein
MQGFTAPRSPTGAAALAPPPPWHFAGDVLAVEFWNDPDVSVSFLPEGVELETGHSVALFADYQFTAQNEEHLDPARYQCRGFYVFMDAVWRGERIAWCPFAYVDNDAAVLRGWILGLPNKVGLVHQTRNFAAAGAASGPAIDGGRFAACVSAHGERIAEARVTLRRKVDNLAGLLDRVVVGRRHFPRLCAGMHDQPAVDEFARWRARDVAFTSIWIGDAELVFPEVYGEELEMLGPLKVGCGFRCSFSHWISEIETLPPPD